MLIIDVPYSEKDEAKALGAKWNSRMKTWLAPGYSYKDYRKFSKWFDGTIIVRNALYLVEGERVCWKCKKKTKVICFAFKEYIDLYSLFSDDPCLMASFITKMPVDFLRYLKLKYNFKEKYSHTAMDSYFANCCSHCDSLQGYNYLFNEPNESPFYADTKEKAQALTIYVIELLYDVCVDLHTTFPHTINGICAEYKDIGDMIQTYAHHEPFTDDY